MAGTKTVVDKNWLFKDEAAALLGVAVRQLEKRARRGFIETKRLPREFNETAARVVYSRTDILALKAGKPNIHAVEVSEKNDAFIETREPGTTVLAVRPTTAAVFSQPGKVTTRGIERADPFAGLAASLAALAAAFPKPAEPPAPELPPWLSLQQAVEYSGLPATFLVERARSGGIRAVNVGQGSREFWRFHREALAK
jgi:hypothetical protein